MDEVEVFLDDWRDPLGGWIDEFTPLGEIEEWYKSLAPEQQAAYDAACQRALYEEAMEAEYQARLAEEAALRDWYVFGAGPY